MNTYLISDTHFNHHNIVTYCQRPENFTELLIENWRRIVGPEDLVIHLGDVFMHKAEGWDVIWKQLTGRRVLIRGNHDRQRSRTWWMENGFDFCCDQMVWGRYYLTHEPATSLASGTDINIHGHLHNTWHGFGADGGILTRKPLSFQRLFAVEYTDYQPVEIEKFVNKPKKYLATGLGD